MKYILTFTHISNSNELLHFNSLYYTIKLVMHTFIHLQVHKVEHFHKFGHTNSNTITEHIIPDALSIPAYHSSACAHKQHEPSTHLLHPPRLQYGFQVLQRARVNT